MQFSKKIASIIGVTAIFGMLTIPAFAGNGHGPGDKTGSGEASQDGTGKGSTNRDCTSAVEFTLDKTLLLARGGNGGRDGKGDCDGSGDRDGRGSGDRDGARDGTGDGSCRS